MQVDESYSVTTRVIYDHSNDTDNDHHVDNMVMMMMRMVVTTVIIVMVYDDDKHVWGDTERATTNEATVVN